MKELFKLKKAETKIYFKTLNLKENELLDIEEYYNILKKDIVKNFD